MSDQSPPEGNVGRPPHPPHPPHSAPPPPPPPSSFAEFAKARLLRTGAFLVKTAVAGALVYGFVAYKSREQRRFQQEMQSIHPAEAHKPPIILEFNMRENIAEYVPRAAGILEKAILGKRKLSVKDVTEALEKAAQHPRVIGVVFCFPSDRTVAGPAQLQEIREAIEKFNLAQNKLSVSFAETYTQGNYYLASSFKKVFVSPVGEVGLKSISIPIPFFNGLLEKLNIGLRVLAVSPYKTFANQYTQKGLTPEHRSQTESLFSSIWSQLVDGVAKGRGLSQDKVRDLARNGPLFAEEALSHNLVDAVAYKDQLRHNIRTAFNIPPEDHVHVISFKKFARAISQVPVNNEQVALIYAVGTINDSSHGSGAQGITPRQMEKAFVQAIENKNVKAIVLRMDSGGGSALASDIIWRYVKRAQESGKKVIASVGNVAASGGYYIISPADKIVAMPSSIIGSIGVIGGKVITKDFLEKKLGVMVDTVHIDGDESSGWHEDFTPKELERANVGISRIYDVFLDKVSTGRKIPKNKLLEYAGGRVYTAQQGKEFGLVDEFGGLTDAIELAKKEAGLSSTAGVKVYPQIAGIKKALQVVTGGSSPDLVAYYNYYPSFNGDFITPVLFYWALKYRNQSINNTKIPELISPIDHSTKDIL